MPANKGYKNITSRPGKHLNTRKAKSNTGRQRGNGTKPSAPKVISNSIFALTLPERSGIEVQDSWENNKLSLKFKDKGNYQKIYDDLLAALLNAYKQVHNEPLRRYDPLKHGFPIGRAISEVIDAFRLNIVPAGYDFNVDVDYHDDYFFTIFRTLHETPPGWWTVGISSIVTDLKRTPRLHDLFIEYISSLWKKTGLNMWFEDEVSGYCMDMLEDEIEYWEANHGDDEESLESKTEAIESIKIYKTGEAYEYERLICQSKKITPEYIKRKLSGFRSKHPILKWMKSSFDLLESRYGTWDFQYTDKDDEDNYDGELRFCMLYNIVWDDNDYVSGRLEEGLECDASNCGIQEPVIHLRIRKDTKDINVDFLKCADKWPMRISDCLNQLWKLQK